MSEIAVKICGIRTAEALQTAINQGADYIGMVFFPRSPRHLELHEAEKLRQLITPPVKLVAVLVDPDDAFLEQLIAKVRPDMLQLHGSETAERATHIRQHFGLPVIKALSIRNANDLNIADTYSAAADYLLFDAKAPADALPGGNGLSFDWTLLKTRHFALPWFLSGGLTPMNVQEAMQETGASRVDVSSGVESSPGTKDMERIKAFIDKARSS